MPLPLEVDIPNEHLPEVLEVYDKDASALYINPVSRVYRHFQENGVCIVPSIDMVREELGREGLYCCWAEFLAHCPVKFVRKYPAPACVLAKDEGMLTLRTSRRPVLSIYICRGCWRPLHSWPTRS